MKLTKALAPIAIAGTVAGGLLATPAAHATHIDVELLSGTAFFVGPTILSTPSATFAQSAVDLYLERLGFDTGDGDLDACRVSLGDCDAPLRLLTTPALVQQGHSSFVGAAEIVRAVHAELDANPDTYNEDNPLWIFGWSQGATAGSLAMVQLAHDGVPLDSLHFVFIGNPFDADGEYPNAPGEPDPSAPGDSWMLHGNQTPTDLFAVTNYSLPGDPVSNHESTSTFGLFYEHMMYLGLTPEQVADNHTTVVGNLTDVDISGDAEQFDTWLNAWGHGLIDSGWWEGLFYSLVASIYDAFGHLEDFFGDWMGIEWSGVEETMDAWFPLDV